MTMENRANKQEGFRLQRLNRIMVLAAVLLGIALVAASLSTNRSFSELEKATEGYIRARKDVADMQAGSDYLTDRVRTFIVTGDPDSAADFFYEVEVTRRRDLAVESMEQTLSGSDGARYLSAALQASNQLAEIERYAMKLAAAGNGLDIGTLPAALGTVTLTAADEALSAEEKLVKAREMVFDATYQAYKEDIRENLALCEQALIGETEDVQKKSTDRLENALTAQTLLIAIVVMAVIFIVLYSAHLIIRPVNALVKAIEEKQLAEERGAYELRFVSRAYNEAYVQSQQNQEALAYKATHDALTGLFNRGAFEKAKQMTRGRAQAMFIFDVDHFKEFNDRYGHDMGDRVLQKVAATLTGNFRTEDYVCRFGGDEFTVLMVHATSAMRELVEKKIEHIRETLRDTADGLPVITLSIGVAFSDRPDPTDDILKDADTALYITKERGRDGYTFYGDKE